MTEITLSGNTDYLPAVIRMLGASLVIFFVLVWCWWFLFVCFVFGSFFLMKGFDERDPDQIKWSSKLNSG